ncbi:ATP-binding cassette domain-containing protein [Glycomyces albidus]|jgi:ABC-2 type transport system ATP-binding protein|uniref:ATP-binding cassette domain-containing protein n=1 Tax=Glycomyces albidus TaxID=2656774 RepID=A0A6L5GEF1_9ACTN|nr:ATP-binding cassette domain-containing protein [Glycomyces albidus]MQM27965.1 ATP-binding cassette domain-containing protein [Glycomyces albidus]
MITAKGLYKRYRKTVAVDHLSFDVRPGVVTGFLGPNGSGKSTTMRLMLGLDHGEGETLFDGKRFGTIRRPMNEVGALLEAKPFHPTRSARNHLRMLAAGNRIPDSRVDEVMEFVGLGDVKRKKPKGYSLGMAQRLGLAQALLGDPQTLLLDEPTNGLDPHGIHWMRDVLKTLASEGRTIFVSSHLLSEMQLMADELVVIGRGTMIFNGDVDTFVREFTQSQVVVRGPDTGSLAETLKAEGADVATEADALVVSGLEIGKVGHLAFTAGVELHELSTRRASLEEAFMSATGASEQFVAKEPVRAADTAAPEGKAL